MGYSPQGCKESDTTERLHFFYSHSVHPVKGCNPAVLSIFIRLHIITSAPQDFFIDPQRNPVLLPLGRLWGQWLLLITRLGSSLTVFWSSQGLEQTALCLRDLRVSGGKCVLQLCGYKSSNLMVLFPGDWRGFGECSLVVSPGAPLCVSTCGPTWNFVLLGKGGSRVGSQLPPWFTRIEVFSRPAKEGPKQQPRVLKVLTSAHGLLVKLSQNSLCCSWSQAK